MSSLNQIRTPRKRMRSKCLPHVSHLGLTMILSGLDLPFSSLELIVAPQNGVQ